MPMPPENRELSPYTGWTRAHWEHAADELLLAVRPYSTPRHGLIHLPGPRPSVSGPRSDGLEGYARTFLLAALRVAGAHGDDPHGHLARYAEGLAAGTQHPTSSPDMSPADPESWPRPADIRQAVVESASVALSLRLTRPWLWDTLDDATRQRAVDWLLPALGPSPVDNNWWLFGLTVAGFLQDVGIETDRARATIDTALARIEDWHLGEGWYSDGPNRAFDHYNAWALHFYPVLHAHLSGDKALLDRYGPRLHAQLDTYTAMFDATGAPMPFGRSLTYRFAAAAAPWLGALTGHTPLTPGATRRLASGTLRHFLDRGATAPDGLLTLGWYGPYPPLIQSYSGPGSPYWASKGFLGLLLPADHPAWTAPEEPLPAETADSVVLAAPPHLLIHSTAADGLVRLHNHGSNHVGPEDDPGYARFAYSTRTGPAHETPDNHFSLLIDGAHTTRGPATPVARGQDWASSAHTPAPGIRVVSATAVHGRAEVRAHLVLGAPPGTPVRQTGWAVTPDGAATAQLHPVHGYDPQPANQLPVGPTPFGPSAHAAVLQGRTGDTGSSLFVALASLTAEPAPAPAATLARVGLPRTTRTTTATRMTTATRTTNAAILHITWEDDGTVTTLELPY
ncbi:DUF2264 domain-containing protein [Streptomyces sp. NBC_00237]|uniref:DUF2264 domain-containing protein n=1 Tax=Streptomyces sp. NBC_00237 TaxID=2975687 RepID=UPI00224DF4D9|nr:DUF2264 domain-containing protein [Streptomyces sp. NBC_00237]MCX5204769.1 DUF2264 domain-containing protein [Streptomyces sp. NBC_00237]